MKSKSKQYIIGVILGDLTPERATARLQRLLDPEHHPTLL